MLSVDPVAVAGAQAAVANLPRQDGRRADPEEAGEEPAHPRRLGLVHHQLAALSRMRSAVTSRSNGAKGNKDLRASLAKLSDMPKDNDEFLAALDKLNKSFQQHVRNERKELLPAVLRP